MLTSSHPVAHYFFFCVSTVHLYGESSSKKLPRDKDVPDRRIDRRRDRQNQGKKRTNGKMLIMMKTMHNTIYYVWRQDFQSVVLHFSVFLLLLLYLPRWVTDWVCPLSVMQNLIESNRRVFVYTFGRCFSFLCSFSTSALNWNIEEELKQPETLNNAHAQEWQFIRNSSTCLCRLNCLSTIGGAHSKFCLLHTV